MRERSKNEKTKNQKREELSLINGQSGQDDASAAVMQITLIMNRFRSRRCESAADCPRTESGSGKRKNCLMLFLFIKKRSASRFAENRPEKKCETGENIDVMR